VGFTDLSGGQGMFAQIEGRTADDVAYWLAMQRPAWRDQVRYVAIDMCTVFVSVILSCPFDQGCAGGGCVVAGVVDAAADRF
jgi:hypothetical protein